MCSQFSSNGALKSAKTERRRRRKVLYMESCMKAAMKMFADKTWRKVDAWQFSNLLSLHRMKIFI